MNDAIPADLAWLTDCPLPVLAIDGAGRVVGASLALERTTGVRREDLVGQQVGEIRSPLARSLCSDEPLIGLTRPGGVDVWLHRRLQPLEPTAHTLHWLEDVSEAARLRRDNEELRARVRQLDLSDSLTGLPNRRAFDQALIQQVTRSRRYGNPLSLIGVDVVPAQPGVPTPDAVVLAVSRYLRDRLRWVDTVGRVDRTRFLVLLPETPERETLRLADALVAGAAAIVLPEPDADRKPALRAAATAWHKGDDPAHLLHRLETLLHDGATP
jgi:diguanylate cyclase (GGDEF)-like protein